MQQQLQRQLRNGKTAETERQNSNGMVGTTLKA